MPFIPFFKNKLQYLSISIIMAAFSNYDIMLFHIRNTVFSSMVDSAVFEFQKIYSEGYYEISS